MTAEQQWTKIAIGAVFKFDTRRVRTIKETKGGDRATSHDGRAGIKSGRSQDQRKQTGQCDANKQYEPF
jgi:hypothetical protein